MLDSLIAAGNSFQVVGAEKLKERLLNDDDDNYYSDNNVLKVYTDHKPQFMTAMRSRLINNKNTFCGTRYLSHCCSLHGTVVVVT